MIKQNGYLEICEFSKTHSVQIIAYSNTWAEWIWLSELDSEFLKKKKKKTLHLFWR